MASPDDDDGPRIALSTPEWHHSPEEVEEMEIQYSTRAPEDWVISGPLGSHGGGPGRRFATVGQAESWVREKYGDRMRGRIMEATSHSSNRWAWLIRGVRAV